MNRFSIGSMTLCVILAAFAFGRGRSQGLHQGVPPNVLWFGGNGETEPATWSDGSQIDAFASYDTPRKALSLRWLHDSGAKTELTVPLSYWPTTLLSTESGVVYCAGKDRFDKTVLLRYEYQPPLLIVNPATGEVSLTGERVTDIVPILRLSSEGQDMIQVMCMSPSDPNEIFLWFWDSHDFYALDLEASALTIAASPDATQGGVYAAGLSEQFEDISIYQHVGDGFFYVFITRQSHPDVLLRDTNYNGVIDDALTLVDDTWSVLGYDDADNYIFPD